jgi:hypothetical protein
VVGKLRRVSHPSRPPWPVHVLHCLLMDLCALPGLYFCLVYHGGQSTFVDEATRYACVGLLHRKSYTDT